MGTFLLKINQLNDGVDVILIFWEDAYLHSTKED